ncbi:phospholipase D family protein [Breoghania sp. JC706]|uniref:phospholipase D family protein n=1 Tax=Breoghania sp. JC706 TaxID=3117732 RepID=UPI00300823EC
MLLDEHAALTEIRELLSGAKRASLAVAFWGAGAVDRLGLDRAGLTLKILCNLESGACNPDELRRIRKLSNVELRSYAKLHAKVYWPPEGAVIGSSNASANGLALEGDAAEAWAEANVRLDDPEELNDIGEWFDAIFAEGIVICDADLDRAELVWKSRVNAAPTGKPLTGNLMTAFANAPDHPAWRRVKLAYWTDLLEKRDQAWLDREEEAGRLPHTISAYSGWNDRISANDWLLDFDMSEGRACFTGIWKAWPEKSHRSNLQLVNEVKNVTLECMGRLKLNEGDISRLGEIAPAVLMGHSADGGRNAIIDLADAYKLLSP